MLKNRMFIAVSGLRLSTATDLKSIYVLVLLIEMREQRPKNHYILLPSTSTKMIQHIKNTNRKTAEP